MHVFAWGIVIALVFLVFNPKARKVEGKGIAIAFLAYLFKRRNKGEKEVTYDQIERRWRWHFGFKTVAGFLALWLYGVFNGWGSDTVTAVYVCFIVGMVCACYLSFTRHGRTVVLPFYMTLCRMGGALWPMDERPSRWIRVPRGAARTGIPPLAAWLLTSGTVTIGRKNPRHVRIIPASLQRAIRDDVGWIADKLWPVGRSEIRVKLPKDMNATTSLQKEVETLVASRFAGQWTMRSSTRKFVLTFVPTRSLPTMVKLPDEWITQDFGNELSVPLGMSEPDKWSYIEMESETPHVLIAGATGSGKTVTITMQIAWVLMHGGLVDIIDPKIVGFADGRPGKIDLRGLPGVRIHTEVESWGMVVEEYRESMRMVYKALQAGEDVDDRAKYPTRLLVIDEKGGYTRAMKTYWKQTGKKGEPTAFGYEDDILQQGRAARHFMTIGAQQANALVLRSTDARFNFGAKIGCGPQDAISWRMLYVGKRQACPMVKGRGHWSTTGEAIPIQFAYLTQDQVVKMAMIGEAVRRGRSSPAGRPLEAVSEPVSEPAGVWDHTEPADAVPGARAGSVVPQTIVGLDAGASFLGMPRTAFQRARERNPIPNEMRDGNRPAWNVIDLREWHSKRPRAGKRTLEPSSVILSKGE